MPKQFLSGSSGPLQRFSVTCLQVLLEHSIDVPIQVFKFRWDAAALQLTKRGRNPDLPAASQDPTTLLERCRLLREAGVDAVNLVDGARAQSRMGVVPAALLVVREVGLETVFHYTCRDRNMLGMLSDLLGAAAGGLRNLLIVTGDPPTAGPYPDATAVFDIDSIGLTNVHGAHPHRCDGGAGQAQ